MEFKIDTKPSYSIITPVSNVIDVALTGAIRQKWEELTQSGSPNVIIDLNHCTCADENALDDMAVLHEEVYTAEQSIVFTQPHAEVMRSIKEKELDLVVNIAPTMKEAIDIVSMENLERDLFNEEP
jgi:anti-anti-sigma regulatory factor